MLRTKLVCTMGPATFSAGVVRDLVDSGMTMARLNMSHGLREDHLEAVALIRRAAEEAGTPVSILVDLGGPKIRVGKHSAVMGAPPSRPPAGAPHWSSWRVPKPFASRPLVHVAIDFEDEVEGPVLLGAGRFTGLGLFRGARLER